ncbi:Early nodulin-like protein 1 [Morus notabilis]|uniref:Early nodulin-like protein 1 n=1 Tax=Morus notabilis TaxID=981085 RepID=W9SWY0_9ROSA|nr:early nodulin-like protein 1 [Morus notabilis]EXC31401.1 Early nodulin-like protein 1 [Morus notabilis]
MAFINSVRAVLLFCFIFSSLQSLSVLCFEFQVGGPKGWVVPPSNDSKIYNDWASKNRFQLGDTIRFKYSKDSVMEVSQEDYKKCNSSRPNFFSNTGNTVFKLDHYGPFYFISGVSGHCERGQHLIIKVKTPGDQSQSDGGKSSASSLVGASKLVIVSLFVLSFVASVVV